MRTRISVPLALSLSFAVSPALALPDFHATSDTLRNLTAEAAQVPELQGAQILQDHASSTIYVSPATRKTQTGTFSPLADAGHCDGLQSLYQMTYLVPPEPVAQWRDVAMKGPYSPFFDIFFGNYVRYATLMDELVNATTRELEFRKTHGDLYAAYVRAKENFDAQQAHVVAAQARLDGLSAAVDGAMRAYGLASTPTELDAARAAVQAAKDERATKLEEYKDALREALKQLENARQPYLDAKAAWAPYTSQGVDLQKAREDLETAWSFVNDISAMAYAASEQALLREENRVVGTASVTFSLFDKELDALRALPSAHGAAINALPVFDVTLGGTTLKNRLEQPSPLASAYQNPQATVAFGVSQVASGGLLGAFRLSERLTPFLNANGVAAVLRVAEPALGPRTIEAPISRGAYCMGTRSRLPKEYSVPLRQGNQRLKAFAYQARTTPLFADSVGLGYKYTVASEPVRASCTLSFSNDQDFQKSSGKVTGLFYSRSWSDSERRAVADSGIRCDVSNLDPGPGAEGRQEFLDGLAQKFSQEVAAEFVLTYGKSWTVVAGDAAALPPAERDKALARMGDSMRVLCGSNPYCQVTGLVLKTLDEIFGTTSGSSSQKDDFRVNIQRDYSRNTFRTVTGEAAIHLEVSGS